DGDAAMSSTIISHVVSVVIVRSVSEKVIELCKLRVNQLEVTRGNGRIFYEREETNEIYAEVIVGRVRSI
ncbi:hypothetical protein, partial [Escherichia coli]|uniref:hypothetical protein n=1 Tax=Escherichia coli TaxID=562 RepID=UPI001BC9FB6C